jgi:hypothetical protein
MFLKFYITSPIIDWLTGGDKVLSGGWIRVSERIVDQLKCLEKSEDKDRLELVRSMRFVLTVLQRSLIGWTQWVNNPEVMTIFSQEDLEKMTETLSNFTRSFIVYDLEVTSLGVKKGLKSSKKVMNKKGERTERFYV